MHIRYYSPMPPAPTGVADYSAALLPYLEAFATVEINPVARENPPGVALYHLGNNALHAAIYRQAVTHPGVVVLHDAVLQHFLLGQLDAQAYEDEFAYNYGPAARTLARTLWSQRAHSGSDARYFAYPLLKRVVKTARAIIVHNPAAAEMVRAHAEGSGCPVVEIPHLFEPPASMPSAEQTCQFRQDLGLQPKPGAPPPLLLATFGHQRETKRPAALLRAFHAALEQGVDVRLLVSGAFVSANLERTLAPLLQHPRILRTGYLSEADFWRYAAATDLCVNLRYPSAAESSGIAVRLMGAGKAVAFSDDPAIARIPGHACLRIDTGPGEEPMLTDYIVWLAADPARARAIGTAAARHIAAHHQPRQAAAAYAQVLRAVSAPNGPP